MMDIIKLNRAYDRQFSQIEEYPFTGAICKKIVFGMPFALSPTPAAPG
jgi:hypothetical protein